MLRPSQRPPRSCGRRARGTHIAYAATALLSLLLAACSTQSTPDTTLEVAPPDHAATADGFLSPDGSITAEQFELDPTLSVESRTQPQPPLDTPQAIISTARLVIEVPDLDLALTELRETAATFDGYLVSESVRSTGSAGAEISLRVPATRFDEAFAAFGKVGTLVHSNRAFEDVTLNYIDLEARVASLETSIDRLTELLADATTTADLLQAETELAGRQAQLDSLKAQLEQLENQIAEATIWVTLMLEGAAPDGKPSSFWEGFIAGVNSLVHAGTWAMVMLGKLVPWLLLAGIVVALIQIVRRSKRRPTSRRDQQAEPQATPPEATPGE